MLRVDKDVSINALGGFHGSALHVASAQGHEMLSECCYSITALLILGIKKWPHHWHCLAENGHSSIVKVLLEAGADSNARDKHKVSPVVSAAEGGNVQCLELILDWPNTQLNESDSGLLWTLTWNRPAMIKVVLERHCIVSSRHEEMNNGTDRNDAGKEVPNFFSILGSQNIEHLETVRRNYKASHTSPGVWSSQSWTPL